MTQDSMYPQDWPACVTCGAPALDGHLTCGDVECGEAAARENITRRIERLYGVPEWLPKEGA